MSDVKDEQRRQFFLSHCWSRYPAWPSAWAIEGEGDELSSWLSGRWPLPSPTAASTLATLRWQRRSLRPIDVDSEQTVPTPEEVLTEGDWVSVNPEGTEIILWAPCLLSGRETPGLPSMSKASLASMASQAERWSKLISHLRNFFLERGFLEASTPTFAPSPGTEAYLDPVPVQLKRWDGDEFTRFAITSPEFHLKKLLAAGSTKIFEIARCVRNLEGGEQHALEFHMLEWYRSFASHREIAEDLSNLLTSLGAPRPILRSWVSLVEEVMQQRDAWSHPALANHRTPRARPEFLNRALQAPGPSVQPLPRLGPTSSLIALLEALDVSWSETDGVNDLLQRLWLERLEPRLQLQREVPLIVESFPPALSALARIDDDGWAARFELYWQGLEIANAFHELNDPEENQQRWARDLAEKRRSGREEVPVDQELAVAFLQGVPPAGGIALGIERLAMALWREARITDVRPFVY